MGRKASETLEKYIDRRMSAARDMSDGTMPLEVVFYTEEAGRMARAWMKGKQRVKVLSVSVELGDPPRGVSTPERDLGDPDEDDEFL